MDYADHLREIFERYLHENEERLHGEKCRTQFMREFLTYMGRMYPEIIVRPDERLPKILSKETDGFDNLGKMDELLVERIARAKEFLVSKFELTEGHERVVERLLEAISCRKSFTLHKLIACYYVAGLLSAGESGISRNSHKLSECCSYFNINPPTINVIVADLLSVASQKPEEFVSTK